MAAAAVAHPSDLTMLSSRPQVGIGRLPVRRPSNESKQSMNCKSCRKRKIKCNRLKPSCEACQVFNCACIYDAVPKKRGPKTDVLEALVKRVNGLEKRFKDEEKTEVDEDGDNADVSSGVQQDEPTPVQSLPEQRMQPRPRADTQPRRPSLLQCRPAASSYHQRESIAFTDALLDTYFSQIHSKPYYILDEANTRQRLREGQLPQFMINAIHAVAIRYVPHICGGHQGAVRTSQDYATQSRAAIDVDEPSIDHLQGLLLLAMANFQAGKGKKSYMLLSHAISMAFALDLHREVPAQLRVASVEREGRRKLFWTCYLMDRFTTSGSKRPPLISDDAIALRYPSSSAYNSQKGVEGTFFPGGANLLQSSGHSSVLQGGAAMLVEIVRVLGVTNRYLASGGVKSDSHFPWHTQSTLSRIRADLDQWAAQTQEAFSSLHGLFGRPDTVTLVLSKLIYHLVHCLLYRPFLPVDLAELSGNDQNQSWQIEAMNLCFMHANAIVELVDIGKTTGILYWPSFVGYCVCTAGTIHVHGAHYVSLRDGDAFANSSDFISREMTQLADLTFICAGVQHQRETMQTVYACHTRLVHSLDSSPMRFSPVFQMDDFFDRYPGSNIDGAHMTFADVAANSGPNASPIFSRWSPGQTSWQNQYSLPSQPQTYIENITTPVVNHVQRPTTKHRSTDSTAYPTPTIESQANPFDHSSSTFPHGVPSQPQVPHHTSQSKGSPSSIPQFHDTLVHNPTLGQSVFSPSFAFSPPVQNMVLQNHHSGSGEHMHPVSGTVERGHTPSAQSSTTMEAESDPFLSFLESLAGGNGSGGAVDLDVFMNRDDSCFNESS